MKKRRRVRRALPASHAPERAVRTIDIPVPARSESLEGLVISKLGSRADADQILMQVAEEFGLPEDAPRSVSAALALTRLGGDMEHIARSLAWKEFEDYCAMAISAAGYAVRRNVRLRKPVRQIDIVAESGSLVLSIDCKHWKRGTGAAGLMVLASAQAERTKMYSMEMSKRGRDEGRAFLPVLLTMLDNQVRVVEGVPVVPLQALRGFLASVSRFDEAFSFFASSGPGS
jgi:Restriction endonuclease